MARHGGHRSERRPSVHDTDASRAACDACGRVVALAELDGPGPLFCSCCGGMRDRRGVRRPPQPAPASPSLPTPPASPAGQPATRGRGPLRR
jgi:hypothetical protein